MQASKVDATRAMVLMEVFIIFLPVSVCDKIERPAFPARKPSAGARSQGRRGMGTCACGSAGETSPAAFCTSGLQPDSSVLFACSICVAGQHAGGLFVK